MTDAPKPLSREAFEADAYLRCNCHEQVNQTCDKCALRAHISALESERDDAREALIEAHNCIVKARDLLQSSEALAPGAISRDAFRRTQDIFEQMQKAIAAIRSELLANGGRDER